MTVVASVSTRPGTDRGAPAVPMSPLPSWTPSRLKVALVLACGLLAGALLAPGGARADITNGGAHVQQIFNSWARPIAACIIVAGAIRAIARRNLVGIVTFLALVLALGGFVISPDRGLNVSNSLLGKILD